MRLPFLIPKSLILIAVKASKEATFAGICFRFSDNEYKIAIENPNTYRIYYVGNVFEAVLEIIILDDFIVDGNVSRYI